MILILEAIILIPKIEKSLLNDETSLEKPSYNNKYFLVKMYPSFSQKTIILVQASTM